MTKTIAFYFDLRLNKKLAVLRTKPPHCRLFCSLPMDHFRLLEGSMAPAGSWKRRLRAASRTTRLDHQMASSTRHQSAPPASNAGTSSGWTWKTSYSWLKSLTSGDAGGGRDVDDGVIGYRRYLMPGSSYSGYDYYRFTFPIQYSLLAQITNTVLIISVWPNLFS